MAKVSKPRSAVVEIKPCPFCGYHATVDQRIVRTTPTGKDLWSSWVVCENVICGGQGGECIDADLIYTRSAAIRLWNRRTP